MRRRNQPKPEEFAAHASAMHMLPEDIELTLCMVAPQCQSSMDYLMWMETLPKAQLVGCVPLISQHPATFVGNFGHTAFQMYDISMRLLGRPHHFTHAAGPKL